MSLLSKIFSRKEVLQSVGAILYPDRIILETQDRVRNGFWIRTNKITILPADVAVIALGRTIDQYLNYSRNGVSPPTDFKILQDYYNNATGLKTLKTQMKDAKYISITRYNSSIEIMPTVNGGATGQERGFSPISEERIEIESKTDHSMLGDKVRLAWSKCK